MPAGLRELQARFYRLVTAPVDVARALDAQGLRPADVEAMIAGDEHLSAVARLDVYAQMYFFRILDVLRDAYPRLLEAIGDDAFHDLATDYLVACPPAHFSLSRAGDRLPGFLASHPPGTPRPQLAALARLERAYVELFDGPDVEALTVDDLRALAPEQVADQSLLLVPCHAQLEDVLVWRSDVTVMHRALAGREQEWLRLVAAGDCTIGRLCEAAAQGREVTEAAHEVFAAVCRWAADGLLARPLS